MDMVLQTSPIALPPPEGRLRLERPLRGEQGTPNRAIRREAGEDLQPRHLHLLPDLQGGHWRGPLGEVWGVDPSAPEGDRLRPGVGHGASRAADAAEEGADGDAAQAAG